MTALLLVLAGLTVAATVAFSIWTLRGGGMPAKPRRHVRLGHRIRRARRKKWAWRRRGILRARGLA